MTIHLLTIPDSPADWPGWLEQELVSLHFGELIEELRLSGDESNASRLGEILSSDELRHVTRHGLADVGGEKIQQLLNSPDALLKLQENILLNETKYWKQVGLATEPSLQEAAARVKTKLGSVVTDPATLTTKSPVPDPPPRGSRRAAWVAVVAMSLMLGAVVWQFHGGSDSAGVLGEANLTANDVATSAEYFQRIADSGQNWFGQPRDTTQQLTSLLQDVSSNCEKLINSRHAALTDAERDWFVEKCGDWKTKFDTVLAQLSAGEIDASEAREQSDKVMNRLVDVLRSWPNV
ncbi:MAG: hypothetical protein NXI04_22105 [Planctomycetaceae bacterium]|nr:hypothetical protein [Planctomycetaceae bacterium]